VTINSASIVILVVSIGLLAYAIYTARSNTGMGAAGKAISNLEDSLEMMGDQVEANKKCHEENRRLWKRVEILEANEHHTDIAMTALREEGDDLRQQVVKLTSKVEQISEEKETEIKEKHEAYEVIHYLYWWITDAVKRFQLLGEEPPELPEDFIIFFDKNIKGRFEDGE